MSDAGGSAPSPLRGLVLAMLVSMLFLLLLRFTAPVMVWVLIVGLLAAGAYGKLKEPVVLLTDSSTASWAVLAAASEMLFLLQGFGTATGSTTTTNNCLPPSRTWASPPTSVFTCRFRRPGWPSVSRAVCVALAPSRGRRTDGCCVFCPQ